jgi:signal transduction histidine kinase
MAAAKSIRLIAKPANEPLIASANEPALHRLLCALVDNALKYTQEEGSVTISAAPVDGSIRLAVADTGIGIAPEALPHIFERFFRADQVRGSGSGTGLGLSIAQAIAKAHGTEITVQSTPDKGSHFDLVLSATGFDPALNGGRHGETL